MEILAERVENRPCELRDDAGGLLALQTSVSVIIDLAAVLSDSSWIAKRCSVTALLKKVLTAEIEASARESVDEASLRQSTMFIGNEQ